MPITAPTDIANCTLWLKGDTGTFEDTGLTTPAADDGDPVKGWEDQSAAGNDVTEGTNNPTLKLNALDNKSGINFSGTVFLTTPSMFDNTYNTAFGWMAVLVELSNGGTDQPIPFSTNPALSHFYMFDRNTGATDVHFDNLTIDSATSLSSKKLNQLFATGSAKIVLGTYNGSYVTVGTDHLYNMQVATGNLGLSGTGRIGGYVGGSFGFEGYLLELVVYKRGLTGGDINDLIDYFYGRYPSLGSSSQKVVVCDGDSLTEGIGATTYANYPYKLLEELGSTSYRVVNCGNSGDTLANLETDGAAQVDGWYEAGATCVMWGGTNDVYFDTSSATTETRMDTYGSSRQTAGWQVVALTMLPRGDFPGTSTLPGDAAAQEAEFEVRRAAINTWVRANYQSFSDAIADVGADTSIGDDGDEDDTTYYAVDKVHLKSVGYQIVAELVAAAILGLDNADDGTQALLFLGGGPPIPGTPWHAARFDPFPADRFFSNPPIAAPGPVSTPVFYFGGGPAIPGTPWAVGRPGGTAGGGVNTPASPPPPPPPPPGATGAGRGDPIVPRAPREIDPQLRRHAEVVRAILNSLLIQGFIVHTPEGYGLRAGFVETRAPTVTDDSGSGVWVGAQWIDTAASTAYLCMNDGVGVAVWKQITLT